MTSQDTIETEQEALKADEEQQTDILAPTELPDAHFGQNLSEYHDYLDKLEQEFAPSADKVSAARLAKIREDLRQIESGQIKSAEASQSLLQVFQNMQAWERQMIAISHTGDQAEQEDHSGYTKSRKVFMTSCHELYPGLMAATSLTLAGSEVFKMERELATIRIPELQAKIKEIQNLEALALEIGERAESDPETAISDLEKISSKISEGIDTDLKRNDLSEDEQKQLSLCVEILYKIQILIDKIKNTEAYKKKKQEAEATQAKTGVIDNNQLNPVETEKAQTRSESDWRVLESDLGSMEAYLTTPNRPGFDPLKFDAEKSRRLDQALTQVWEDYQKDERAQHEKMPEYKNRIGMALSQIL